MSGRQTGLPPYTGPGGIRPGLRAAPYILVITAPDQDSRHWRKGAGSGSRVLLLQLQARSWLSSRLEAGTSDDFVQFLGGLGHLVQLSGNSVKIPRSLSRRAIQVIDADHVLDRLDRAERSFCLDPYPVGLVCIPVTAL